MTAYIHSFFFFLIYKTPAGHQYILKSKKTLLPTLHQVFQLIQALLLSEDAATNPWPFLSKCSEAGVK